MSDPTKWGVTSTHALAGAEQVAAIIGALDRFEVAMKRRESS